MQGIAAPPSKFIFRQIWLKFRPICKWVIFGKMGKFGKIWIKFDWDWTKIRILHPQKHSISYSYASRKLLKFLGQSRLFPKKLGRIDPDF